MPDILKQICKAKREEISALESRGEAALLQMVERQGAPRGFRAALAASDRVSLIAEVKRASPSAGTIREDLDAALAAREYARGGARCISVLTDRREARAWGADCMLLIVAALEAEALRSLLELRRELRMDALVEVHDEAELAAALEAGADLVGINNRNLRTFDVDLAVSERLAATVPDSIVKVSESGIRSRTDVARLKSCGIDAVLVGEHLMRQDDLAAAAAELSEV